MKNIAAQIMLQVNSRQVKVLQQNLKYFQRSAVNVFGGVTFKYSGEVQVPQNCT